MRRRNPDRAEEIREELEALRNELQRGELTNEQYAAQSARLIHALAKVEPRRRFAET